MATRRYTGDGIVVLWDSSRCIHTAICLNVLPEVFDVTARPWVNVGGAAADSIAAAVEKCPTGALKYERPGGRLEEPREPTIALPVAGGPLVLRGAIRLLDPDGNPSEETRLTLCRCGKSGNQPFCDNSHRTGSSRREEAESPADICPPQEERFA
jgi:uncharacterized Fe-S cluster protein YjdI/CDGSH-type Zn-finger protein